MSGRDVGRTNATSASVNASFVSTSTKNSIFFAVPSKIQEKSEPLSIVFVIAICSVVALLVIILSAVYFLWSRRRFIQLGQQNQERDAGLKSSVPRAVSPRNRSGSGSGACFRRT